MATLFDDDWDAAALEQLAALERAPRQPLQTIAQPVQADVPPPPAAPKPCGEDSAPAWKPHACFRPQLQPDAVPTQPVQSAALWGPWAAARGPPVPDQGNVPSGQVAALVPPEPPPVPRPPPQPFDPATISHWVYPTNVRERSYQFEMTSQAVRMNLLVSLPTGLGKTLIAAVTM